MKNFDKKLIVEKILKSSKYQGIYRPVVVRIVDDLAGRYPEKELEKAVRKKMHQIWGAYAKKMNFVKQIETFQTCTNNYKLSKQEKTKSCIVPILQLQTSTDERISILDEYYKKIFALTGKTAVVFEPACGLNALTYFWMGEGVKYVGYDVDQRQIDFVNQIFAEAGVENEAKVVLGDIFEEKYIESDVTMFLKVLILLERQRKGCTLDVMKKCKSKYIVVSFPTKSISGKEKGMREYYKKYFLGLVENEEWVVDVVDFENEVVFVISKK